MSKILLIVSLAGVGVLLVFVPSWLLDKYQAVSELGPFWARVYLVVVGGGGVLFLGATGYVAWRVLGASSRKRKRRRQREKNPSQLSAAEQQAELDQNLAQVDQLKLDLNVSDELRGAELAPLSRELERKRESQRLEIVAFGTISSGKSSLLNALAGQDMFPTNPRGGTTLTRNEIAWEDADKVVLVDTPGLAEVDGQQRQRIAAEAAKDADLVLLVLDGPLRHSEFELLDLLTDMEKRVLVCLNKQDWYSPTDRDALLRQLAEQVGDRVAAKDIVAVHSQITLRPRVRVSAGGEEIEEHVEVPPDIGPLADRMLTIVRREGKDLVLANMLLQSRGLLDEARVRVRESLDRRARQIVGRYMWMSSGAVAATPFPFVDLAAGVGISSKMVVELARVYKQDLDLAAATELLAQQGKNLAGAVGGYALAEGAKGVASMIKAVPGVGYLAGGLLQGVIQAVITRWIGGVFIELFRHEMQEPPGGLAAVARQQWQKVTSVDEIRRLVSTARQRLADDVEDEVSSMATTSTADDTRFQEALASIDHAIRKIDGCSEEEKRRLRQDLAALRAMETKLTHGRVEVVIFGEISTGKSALINALVGRHVSDVNVRGGWTKEVWNVQWHAEGYRINGLSESELVLVDTPGLNEVGGDDRAKLSRDIAQRADLILFVTDSDLNEIEFSALVSLAASNKPIIVVLNKIDLYSRQQREDIIAVLRERLENILPAENLVLTAADPREKEYVIESPDGATREEWRKPAPDVEPLKGRILEVLERDGLALLALNGAMYAADKTDRIVKLRVELRERQANQVIWSFASFKALAVAVNPVIVADVLGGTAVDASMVITLAHIYGLEMSWPKARKLITSIAYSAGWVVLSEWATHLAAGALKTLTLGFGTALTMVPQGAAAGFGSYIVGQAAKYYFEHGASWGHESPKTVVQRILAETDKNSVLEHLKNEISKKISRNVHSEGNV